jgi:ABC-type polysaccharide/polyol phosphate transport system ATPase subunit
MTHIRLRDLSFSYPIYGMTNRSLKVTVMRQLVGGQVAIGNDRVVIVNALRDLTFELEPGDRLGLLGPNGSGKTTLLRLLAGLAHPTSGKLDVEGRIMPLIDKGLGIHPELTGRQNIELPLRLLGASDMEVRQAQLEIPEWTGLGQFLDLPVRTYSEGMRARLLFAICTALHGDILILDEWLGAGDASFAAAAEARLHSYLNRTQIVVCATHSFDLLRRFCNKVAWLENGQLVMLGPVEEVLTRYCERMFAPAAAAAE